MSWWRRWWSASADRLEEVGVVVGWCAGSGGCGVKSGRFWNVVAMDVAA